MENLSLQKEPPQLLFSAHKIQVRKELPLYVGVGGGVDGGRVCVCGIDDRYIDICVCVCALHSNKKWNINVKCVSLL